MRYLLITLLICFCGHTKNKTSSPYGLPLSIQAQDSSFWILDAGTHEQLSGKLWKLPESLESLSLESWDLPKGAIHFYKSSEKIFLTYDNPSRIVVLPSKEFLDHKDVSPVTIPLGFETAHPKIISEKEGFLIGEINSYTAKSQVFVKNLKNLNSEILFFPKGYGNPIVTQSKTWIFSSTTGPTHIKDGPQSYLNAPDQSLAGLYQYSNEDIFKNSLTGLKEPISLRTENSGDIPQYLGVTAALANPLSEDSVWIIGQKGFGKYDDDKFTSLQKDAYFTSKIVQGPNQSLIWNDITPSYQRNQGEKSKMIVWKEGHLKEYPLPTRGSVSFDIIGDQLVSLSYLFQKIERFKVTAEQLDPI